MLGGATVTFPRVRQKFVEARTFRVMRLKETAITCIPVFTCIFSADHRREFTFLSDLRDTRDGMLGRKGMTDANDWQ